MVTLFEDTRQQARQHENVHDFCQLHGIEIYRSKLPVGDYSFVHNFASVDTKQNMAEVYGNCVGDFRRFHNEYTLAERFHIPLIILVEDLEIRSLDEVPEWVNPLQRRYENGDINPKTRLPFQKPRQSQSLANQMRTIAEQHNVRWEFCHPKYTGQRIIELLYEYEKEVQ